VLIVVIVLLGGILAFALGSGSVSYGIVIGLALILVGAACFAYVSGQRRHQPDAVAIAATLAEAKRLYEGCRVASEARREKSRHKVNDEFTRVSAELSEQWDRADEIETEFHQVARRKIEAQVPRVFEKNASLLLPRLKRISSARGAQLQQANDEATAARLQFTERQQSETATFDAEEKTRWAELSEAWKREIVPIYEAVREVQTAVAPGAPEWKPSLLENWDAPVAFTPATRFGALAIDLASAPGGMPQTPALPLPGSAQVQIPLALTFPEQGSLLFETSDSANRTVISVLNNIVLRLLATTPPGKASFTILDPIGLGQSFAGLMHLSDYEESLINRRIWTQRDQIEERLAELSEHIEKVIQMYLRNEYQTITEYNAQAGSVAEKYHFLVVADFPANFSEIAVKRLQSIAVSGGRCGIFTLIHWDERQPMPDGFAPDELRKNSVRLRQQGEQFVLNKEQVERGAALVFDAPPEPELAVSLVHQIGKSSIDSNRVQVPFEQVAPEPAEMWTNDTTSELRIAIGRTGATKLQYLAIGKGTRQHALFAGKTGSGKSTLFHVIITNLALTCSPDQVEFYLIDFKKGVEFKCYAEKRLPHARVVAIESDREFALSVLQRVDEELKRRGDMFRQLGIQDIAGYKRAGGKEPMPRTLLLIDEFQEFFVEDDSVAQTASLLFDRIVRQGRAFGIHVLLGSQTLGGAYSLARATLGQMVIRVALQCNEADAYLIMDDTNSAPRLLSRPGEGIYNDSAGAVEGNSPFQVVWLADEERDLWLDKVRALAEANGRRFPSPIVFEGNSPADIRENDLLRAVRAAQPTRAPHAAYAWLGAPNSIKGPTEVAFHRQSGNHLLIVGQREEAALTMLGLSLLALAAQYPPDTARFVFFHTANPGSREAGFIEQILGSVAHPVMVVANQDIAEAMNTLAAELKARTSGEIPAEAPPVFLLIHGLHKFKKLRQEDDFSFSTGDSDAANPGAQMTELITEGSSHGMHILASIDTFNNVNRSMNRKALSEFEMRVLFQMSANDSASLIDSPKASGLGLHRALFYNEHEGSLETFRPYAVPDAEWIRGAGETV
ncbi:MAG TPA: FtsK/SpoIIIE domain-containing protein, partial [Chthoniobacteraceae bacterium]|nr:FtsK/SpoIIIE domain-containing protein [Chthoniobacteraceae bacterium]